MERDVGPSGAERPLITLNPLGVGAGEVCGDIGGDAHGERGGLIRPLSDRVSCEIRGGDQEDTAPKRASRSPGLAGDEGVCGDSSDTGSATPEESAEPDKDVGSEFSSREAAASLGGVAGCSPSSCAGGVADNGHESVNEEDTAAAVGSMGSSARDGTPPSTSTAGMAATLGSKVRI